MKHPLLRGRHGDHDAELGIRLSPSRIAQPLCSSCAAVAQLLLSCCAGIAQALFSRDSDPALLEVEER